MCGVQHFVFNILVYWQQMFIFKTNIEFERLGYYCWRVIGRSLFERQRQQHNMMRQRIRYITNSQFRNILSFKWQLSATASIFSHCGRKLPVNSISPTVQYFGSLKQMYYVLNKQCLENSSHNRKRFFELLTDFLLFAFHVSILQIEMISTFKITVTPSF